jgi:predicted RecB family nuclease
MFSLGKLFSINYNTQLATMEYSKGTFKYYASDLSTHISCKHASQLNRKVALKEIDRIFRDDPVLDALKERGREHEEQYVNHLKAQDKKVTDSKRKTFEETVAAMRDGTDVIVQGRLGDGEWEGFPDILLKVEGESKFGNWTYEVQDTKLSRNTRTSTIIQLCFYTDLLHAVQGSKPKSFHVVIPSEKHDEEFDIASYRYSDFRAYYQHLKSRFIDSMQNSPIATYPEEVNHCSICNWWTRCDTTRRNDDHLSLVAGIRKAQIEELRGQNITTLEAFARTEELTKPERGTFEVLVKKQLQAKIQFEGRVLNNLIYRSIESIDDKRGFNRLPEPSPGDVYFDIEGDAFFSKGSLEYLFGIAFRDDGKMCYECFWARNRVEEKHSFERLMNFILTRLKKYPKLSIYHFGAYEPSTVKRLAHIYAVAEQELDDLLRHGKFVDLHTVFKESLLASVERYSLKDVEKFTDYVRKVELREAGKARKVLERALQLKEFEKIPTEIIELVRGYNEDDCFATEALHEWLENLREKQVRDGRSFDRPSPSSEPPSENLIQLEKRSKLLFASLTVGLPENREEWQDEHRAKWLLANQLQYFRRESKTAWWEHFRRQKADLDELYSDRDAIVGLSFISVIAPGDCPVHRYSFPEQEISLKAGNKLFIVNSFSHEDPIGVSCGKIHEIDCEKRFVDIKKTANTANVHPGAVHHYDIIDLETLWTSILSIASEIDDNGLSRMGDYRPAKDLLMRRNPHLKEGRQGATPLEGEDLIGAASRIALNLNRSILPIQGPPGTGKTFTGAHMILALLKAGKTVGVTAVSHRVITTMFEAVHKEAVKKGIAIDFVHKVKEKMDLPKWVKQQKEKKKLKAAIGKSTVIGATAFLWAEEDFRDSLDYLFVDEAGQMSLSQVLAASRAAENIILLGDPQQLEQPQRGAHPENSGVSALAHLLGENEVVMPKEKGLFLNVTYRINPRIAEFTSEIFYKGKLDALPELERQTIHGETRFKGAGLFYVPVEHSTNQNRSTEEVETITTIVTDLIDNGSWSDQDGKINAITSNDILIVAPYNAQVDALKEALNAIDIGTVDKFQGREAPVVIYSMASSTVQDAPRGLNFLFNPNRLNVATSRAKCACILVASPTLFDAECNTIEQMKWANALCRYRQLSRHIMIQ